MQTNHTQTLNRMAARRSLGRKIVIGVGIFFGSLLLIHFAITKMIYLSFSVPSEAMEETIMAGDWILADKVSYSDGELPERGKIIIFNYPGGRDVVEPPEEQQYLKRCVGIAGDLLEVKDHLVYINGVKESFPLAGQIGRVTSRSDEQYQTFPRMKGFTAAQWGPMRVPKRGDVIPLNDTNSIEWEVFIQREGHTVQKVGGGIAVDGTLTPSYTVERDYVFTMGDNRTNSLDSRFWGFVPVEAIIGIPVMVYFSRDEESGEMSWDRVGTKIE